MSPALWLALASLLVVPASADSFDLPHQLVLALGASVVAWRAPRSSVSRRHVLVAVTWLGAALLSTVFSQSRASSLPALFTLATAVSLSLFVSRAQRWTPLLWTAWPIAAYALAQALGHDVLEWGNVATWCGGTRPFSTLGHPTQLAVWMAMVAVLSLEEGQRGTPRAFAWLTAAVCAVTCLATLSRAGWLALGVGAAAWAALRLGHDLRRLRWLGMAAAGVVLLATALAGPAAVLERVGHALVAPTRVQLWGTALAGFAERPFFGWGLDTFVLVDQQLRHPEAWKYEWGGTAAHAHSFPAQVLATQGVVGAVVAVALGLFVLRTWRRGRSPLLAPVLGLAAASLVAFSGVLVLALGWCVLAASLHDVERRMPRGVWFLTLVPLVGTALLFGASLAGAAAERATLTTPGATSGRDAATSQPARGGQAPQIDAPATAPAHPADTQPDASVSAPARPAGTEPDPPVTAPAHLEDAQPDASVTARARLEHAHPDASVTAPIRPGDASVTAPIRPGDAQPGASVTALASARREDAQPNASVTAPIRPGDAQPGASVTALASARPEDAQPDASVTTPGRPEHAQPDALVAAPTRSEDAQQRDAERARAVASADRLFGAAARLDVWTAEWPVRHGAWLEQQQRLAEALARYELAATRAPGVAVFEANVGRVAAKLQDARSAHEWFERARRHAPLDARIALDAAEAALRLGELSLAEDTLRGVLSLYPADGPAWLMLARVRLAQRRAVEARAALEASLDADWRDWPEGLGVARAALAALQQGLGDPALAAQTRAGVSRFALPSDICGEPSKLERARATLAR